MQPQKLAGRRTEPMTCVPSAALTAPTATAAAEPLDEPPGVCAVFHGLRVPRGSEAANSVVTVLPTITAPASRSARTLAASFSERQPKNSGEPIWVGISKVSMTSLMPIGMPTTGEPALGCAIGRSARRRQIGADECADARFPGLEQFQRLFEKLSRRGAARGKVARRRKIRPHCWPGLLAHPALADRILPIETHVTFRSRRNNESRRVGSHGPT